MTTGSGVIPIIKHNNEYYFILFETNIKRREKNKYPIIEEAGGNLELKNIKFSGIRELFEESSGLLNLQNHYKKIKTKIKYNNYIDYFAYIGSIDINLLKNLFINNNRKFWKNNFSIYTENKNIIYIPIKTLFNKKLTQEIQDIYSNIYYLYSRVFNIFCKLISKTNYIDFISLIKKNKIKTNLIIKDYTYYYKNKKFITSEITMLI